MGCGSGLVSDRGRGRGAEAWRRVAQVGCDSVQGDAKFAFLLEKMGCTVRQAPAHPTHPAPTTTTPTPTPATITSTPLASPPFPPASPLLPLHRPLRPLSGAASIAARHSLSLADPRQQAGRERDDGHGAAGRHAQVAGGGGHGAHD